MRQVLLVSQPVEKQLDQTRQIFVRKQLHRLQLVLATVFRHIHQHKVVHDIHQLTNRLLRHPQSPLRTTRLGIRVLLLGLRLFDNLTRIRPVVLRHFLVYRPRKHHEEREQNIEVVRLVEPFVNLGQKLTKNISTGLLVHLLRLIVFRLLLLRIEIDVNVVKGTVHVDLLENSVVRVTLQICHEVTQTVDTISSNIVRITVTVVHLLLSHNRTTCFGRPRRFAYSERGFITCPGAYIEIFVLGHYA